jgi:hypothetical protein
MPTKAEIKAMSDAEFNQFMVEKVVDDGSSSMLTPAKAAYTAFEGAIGTVSYGLIQDVPARKKGYTRGEEATSTKAGADKGGEGHEKSKPESMWTDKCYNEDQMVYVYWDSKGHKVKLNKKNPMLVRVFINISDSKYKSKMNLVLDEIFGYCDSVAYWLGKFPPKEPDVAEDWQEAYENIENYFLDQSFKKWFTKSPTMTESMEKLEEMNKDLSP